MANKKASLIAGGTFLLFVLGAWLAVRLLALQGTRLWVVVGALLLLGLVAAALVFLLVRSSGRKAHGAAVPDSEIGAAIRAAQTRLSNSQRGGASGIRQLPLTLVLGPAGSAKTASIVQSGLEPELLAGEVHRGEAIVPTKGINVWYADQMVLLEAGGDVLAEPAQWQRLVRAVQPSRLRAALGRGSQPPRLAVVCLSCEDLLQPGSADAIPATARMLRGRLAEAAAELGVQLPVYVLFTKADRLPYFRDYVRSLSGDEAQQVLGATLPMSTAPESAPYAERQSGRLREAFERIFHSLARKRLDVLPRETPEEIKAGIYEFPREFRKASSLAVDFLVELCKPSQLGVSPLLRGFYFTGARASVVSEPAAPTARSPDPAALPALGATSVFDARHLLQNARSSATAPGTRNVVERLFLKRVFRDVILRDDAAMKITGGGTRVQVVQRGVLAVAAALFLILAAGLVVSYINNRALVREASAATAGVNPLELEPAGPVSVEALRRLDALRAQAERVSAYEREGHPWRLGWGLYTGTELYPKLRMEYFDHFDRLLWGETRERLLGSLAANPESPTATSEYGATYDDLKAHLVTTSHPTESTAGILVPVLMKHSRAASETDPERAALIQRQFDFFARELPFGNPYTHPRNEPLVARTRTFLNQFAGVERSYQAMLSEASRVGGAVQFQPAVSAGEPVVRNSYVVPGAFTRDGWEFVQENLNNVDRLFVRERWVLGDQAVAEEQSAQLARELRSRYVTDYTQHWQQYLRSGSIGDFANPADGAAKLARLSSIQSPLLQMLALASRHTDVDSATIGEVFRPVHLITPPTVTDRLVTEPNAPYMQALGMLGSSLAQVAATPAQLRAQPLTMAATSVQQVEGEVQKIAQNFSIQGAAQQVGDEVQRLLRAPALGANGVIQTMFAALPSGPGAEDAAPPPGAGLNEAGASFCRPFQQLARTYPFNAQANTVASVDDVIAAFKPGGSAFSLLQDETGDLVVLQGSRYVARPGAEPQPSAAFVSFLNRANQISGALFDERGEGPEVVFQLRPQATSEIPEIRVVIDGTRASFTRTRAASATFAWNAASAGEARVSGLVGGSETTLLEGTGTWGLFRLFQQAAWERVGNGRYTLRWDLPGQDAPLVADLVFADGEPVFMPGALRLTDCTSRITQ